MSIVHSGTCGTCYWSIDDAGSLVIRPSSGSSGYLLRSWLAITGSDLPWYEYASEITSVAMSGAISIRQENIYGSSSTETGNASGLFQDMSNCGSISGIDSLAGLTRLDYFLFDDSSLTSIGGIESLDVSAVDNFYSVFSGCSSLTSLDLSGWDTSSATNMNMMFSRCESLTSVTFGASFTPVVLGSYYSLGFVDAGMSCVNQTNGISVSTDEAFRALTPAQRQGTWRRFVTEQRFTATAERSSGSSPDDDGSDVLVSFNWVTNATTTTRAVSVYVKAASDPDYPSLPSVTKTVSGDSGSDTVVISSVGDGAVDLKVIFDDGTMQFYAFPSVSSNVKLFQLDPQGNAELLGNLSAAGGAFSGNVTIDGTVNEATFETQTAGDFHIITKEDATSQTAHSLEAGGAIYSHTRTRSSTSDTWGSWGSWTRRDAVDLIAIDTQDITVGSTSAGSNASGSATVTSKSGYTPVAILDWWWASGTRQNWFQNYGVHLENTTLYYRFLNNHASSTANGVLRVRVLYVRTDGLA